MDGKRLFDFNGYLKGLTEKNKMARRNGYAFTTCSGIENMEGVLYNFQGHGRFVVADEVASGEVWQNGGGWMHRRTITCFVVERSNAMDEPGRIAALARCRTLERQLLSRMLRDREAMTNELVYMNLENIPYTELGTMALDGLTGLYFMVTIDEPTDISYNGDDWED